MIRCAPAGICPGTAPGRQRLVPLQVHAARGAGDDRRRPEARRHPRGLRHEPGRRRPADRVDGVHGQGRGQVRGHHPRRWLRGKIRNQPQHFAIVLDREIRTWPPIDYTDGVRSPAASARTRADHRLDSFDEAKDIALVLQTGALPVKFVTLDQTEVSATLGKDSLAGGEDRRARRPDRRRALPAPLLPLPRPRRRARPRRLRGVPLRGDPPLQRHADAAGLRGPRAHARRRGRREHRHLRTHQGRGARRAHREGRHLDRLHEGLRHDRRRQRGHHDHRPRALRRGHGQRARLRADAPGRHRDLDAHRSARDACLARGARRLQVARQPALRRDVRAAASRAG